MCGRTSLFVPVDDLEDRFAAEAVVDLPPRYNIPPGAALATVPNDRPDVIDGFEWGLLPGWVDDPDGWVAPINARAETVAEKPAFREALAKRRCLVLADGFYEWRGGRGHRQPYRIERADGAPFAFAGLWETGGGRHTVTIVTTAANGVVAPIHDRMPVMLEPDDHGPWLAGADEAALLALLDPFPDALTAAYPVSTRVNDPANDDPAVVEPVDVAEQSGLGEFGS